MTAKIKIKKEYEAKSISKDLVCYREGIRTRNPFFNFLRQYRKKNCGLTIIEQAIAAGKIWGKMSLSDKSPFITMAEAEKKKNKELDFSNIADQKGDDFIKLLNDKYITEPRNKSSAIKKRCYKEGIRTKNPFLNYLRHFRLNNCGMTIIQQSKEAALEWQALFPAKKYPYIDSALKEKKKRQKILQTN